MIRPVPDKLAAQFMLKRDGCTGEAFVAVYKSVKDAIAAVAKLHGQAAGGGGQQQQQGKKGKQAAAAAGVAACRLWARQLSGEGLHQKRWRLVVRNLPFTVSGTGCTRAADVLRSWRPSACSAAFGAARAADSRRTMASGKWHACVLTT